MAIEWPRRRRCEPGSVNWTALLAIAATAMAVAAMATALLVHKQVRDEMQRATLRSGLDSLWHFTSEWDGTAMVETRAAAATALLDNRADHDVDGVLDFFDEIGLLVSRDVLDAELVWYEFYWPMANYWAASKEYVVQTRRDDPSAWEYAERTMRQVTAIESRRRTSASPEVGPTRAQVREFLEAEVGQSACQPDDEEDARMTPL